MAVFGYQVLGVDPSYKDVFKIPLNNLFHRNRSKPIVLHINVFGHQHTAGQIDQSLGGGIFHEAFQLIVGGAANIIDFFDLIL